MPSSWSSRLLHSSSTPTRSSTGRTNGRDKPLPQPPGSEAFEPPPTLAGRDGERAAAPSPPRPQTSGVSRSHTHNRSVSHPLPKLFHRKKSQPNIGQYNDADVPFDDDLVPVLGDSSSATPTRAVSGKKGKPDDEEKLNRVCMCCDSMVKVPKELEKFRCLCCLTINDLQPLEEQIREEKEKNDKKRSDAFGPPRPLPLSIERTKGIIDRCVVAYLESRCRREDEQPSTKRGPTPVQTPEEKENPIEAIAIRTKPTPNGGKQLVDVPLSTSPPDTPQSGQPISAASAVIKDFSDFDHFAYTRTDTPPTEKQPTPHGPGPPTPIARKPVPAQPNRKPPPPPMDIGRRTPSQKLTLNGGLTSMPQPHDRPPPSPRPTAHEIELRRHYDRVKVIFRPLEDYIIDSFGDFKCLNSSFSTIRPTPGRTRSESNIVTPPPEPTAEHTSSLVDMSQLDAKTILLGDIGENSTWWTGRLDRNMSDKLKRKRVGEGSKKPISSRSPNINWHDLAIWYDLVHTAGENWQARVERLKSDAPDFSQDRLQGPENIVDIEDDLAEAREHTVRTLFKVTENILKRPGRLLKEPEDLRFLLIMLANPSLYPSTKKSNRMPSSSAAGAGRSTSGRLNLTVQPGLSPQKSPRRDGSQHSGILKRIFGLLANVDDACHRYVINWLARFDEAHFTKIVDLVASFINHRIARRSARPQSKAIAADGGLIPDLSGSAMNTSAQLHAAMGLSGSVKKRADDPDQEPEYASDWQIKAAAKVMSLLFAANNIWQGRRKSETEKSGDQAAPTMPQAKAKRSGQLLHTSSFYSTLLDYQDMIADFKVWESKRDRFAFCQFPFFLSMGAKIKILEYDARRQMEIKAREAYFDSVIRQRALDGYFHLRVRRDCMVDDSLRQISEAVGAGQEDLKKGLRVHFTGEEGVDAGGLRKEWFLMLVRDIFDPNHGLFVYDDESNACYFNPHSFETSDQYFLVGALLGLAIYNSTILDIALPPFAFRKLLAAAPAPAAGSASVSSLTGTKGQMTYTLSDLAEFRPSLAAGLQQLLDFDGDVQETYCRDFVAPVDRYDTTTNVPLIPNGENTPVTNANRQEFVDAYIRFLLDTAVVRQFEPFKRGFFQVCAGNALSLFRAEEIELLVRGSDEALDVDSLRAVAVYENWKHFQAPHGTVSDPADSVPVIQWFWEAFANAAPERQRRLLTFITGTDRIPAVGATSLVLRIVAGGDGWGGGGQEERERFPVARTCFNMLVLWRYDYQEALEEKLWRAVEESEGFGLK